MVELSVSQINRAGDVLRDKDSSKEDVSSALAIVHSLREKHKHPMNVFKNRLKKVSKRIDSSAIVAERLKRISSIIKKLNRVYQGSRPTLKLSKMQDIAGCRIILSDINSVKKLCREKYVESNLKHELVREKNYIDEPKKGDGYRSIHLVYKFFSDKEGKKKHNGSLVEIQFRTKLQHFWATAVEAVDLFTDQAIKSNEGKKEWIYFFKLVSSAFAMEEKAPTVEGITTNKKELYSLIRQQEKKLSVISKLESWTKSLRLISSTEQKNEEYFLLEIDTKRGSLTITGYPKSAEKTALRDYSEVESRIYKDSHYDVVLVGVDSIKNLKGAYPNYFVDTREFLNQLKKIIS